MATLALLCVIPAKSLPCERGREPRGRHAVMPALGARPRFREGMTTFIAIALEEEAQT